MQNSASNSAANKKHHKPLACRLRPGSQAVFEQFCDEQRHTPSRAAELLIEAGLAAWQQGQFNDFRIQAGDNA